MLENVPNGKQAACGLFIVKLNPPKWGSVVGNNGNLNNGRVQEMENRTIQGGRMNAPMK